MLVECVVFENGRDDSEEEHLHQPMTIVNIFFNTAALLLTFFIFREIYNRKN
jgi:hypothetical protein